MTSSDPSEEPAGLAPRLLPALARENTRLRVANAELTAQIDQLHQAQAALARHLRVTAPLRQLQQSVRLVRTRRRRSTGQRPATPAAWPAAPRALSATPEQVASRPLLGRTIELLGGRALAGRPADVLEPARGRSGRVAVLVHVYYPELWPEMAERIQRIPVPVDLVVTLVERHSDALADRIVADFPEVRLVVTPNRGRDLWPFVKVLELGLIGDHDAVLKLHTKASVHRVDGKAWRRAMLDSLCPSPEGVALILGLFERDPSLGMIAPTDGVLGQEFWGSNGPLIEALSVRTGIGVDPARTWFAGGSMFWARPEPLLRLRDAALTVDDFEYETPAIDGTTAHALERFLGALVGAAGFDVIEAGEVPGRLARVIAEVPPVPGSRETAPQAPARRSSR